MGRKRLTVDGVKYRVGASITRQEKIFRKKKNRALLIYYIKRAQERLSFDVEDLSIKGHEFTMVINPSDEFHMAQIMKSVLGGFAVKYNYMIGTKGHVWYGRFSSEPCL